MKVSYEWVGLVKSADFLLHDVCMCINVCIASGIATMHTCSITLENLSGEGGL